MSPAQRILFINPYFMVYAYYMCRSLVMTARVLYTEHGIYWQSTEAFFYFNVVWKKLFLGKQIISVPEAFALGVSKGKALQKCAKQQPKPPTVLKRRLNILKEMLGLFQFLQKQSPNPLPHFQALVLGTQHLGTLNENRMVSWTTSCEH